MTALLGQGHQAGGPEQREVVLDRRLGELELLGDLGQVQSGRASSLQDPQPRLVAERAMEADDASGGASGSSASSAASATG